MKDVSAIIFSNTLTLGKLSSLSKSIQHDPAHVINVRYAYEKPHYRIQEVNTDAPEDLLDGLYVFHNPNANKKFDCKELQNNHVLEVSLDKKGIHMNSQRNPIVSRYCSPMGNLYSDLLIAMAASEFNETIAYE